MNSALRNGVPDIIWPTDLPSGVRVFAILDGAQDDRISYEVESTFCEHDCLYAGDLPLELQRAAPYIVQIDRDDRIARFILENGWGKSWGVFLRADTGLKSVRKHLRSLLRVKDERGSRLIFRFYDPRVLRVYLPTCSRSELQTVFGPIHCFILEGGNGQNAIEMKLQGQGTQQTRNPNIALATKSFDL
ncbi:MAG TPA: DUF4123 domain-containing protein [Bryobacteraceae bacterium]|nr:DUF4123 domain-containing protein [Bryobacteraceae bacterium]